MSKFVIGASFALAFSLAAAEKNPPAAAPTYAKDVSRIIQKHCQGCHRPGQIGPFSLMSYEETSAFATEIKKATRERRMPPWHAVPGYGEFKNDRRLSDAEIDALSRWADAGTPKGDPKDMPPPVHYSDDWALGKPDAIVTPDVAFELEPSGVDEYRCFVVPTSYAEDRTIQAVEVRPENRKIVHHVLLYTDVTGKARQLDAADSKPGFSCFGGLGFLPHTSLGGWAPGAVPSRGIDDVGRFLAKGADVVVQVHYHRNGKHETDRSSVGFHFNKQPAKRFLRSQPVLNLGIRIPPGEENHREAASWTAREDLLVTGVTPHMHLLGKEMRIVATLPDGTVKDLVWVKNYSFNWQTGYAFKQPMLLPKGTRIDVTGYFDNSEKNAANPNRPLREVRWGEGTTDEMLIGWIGFISDSPTGRR